METPDFWTQTQTPDGRTVYMAALPGLRAYVKQERGARWHFIVRTSGDNPRVIKRGTRKRCTTRKLKLVCAW